MVRCVRNDFGFFENLQINLLISNFSNLARIVIVIFYLNFWRFNKKNEFKNKKFKIFNPFIYLCYLK